MYDSEFGEEYDSDSEQNLDGMKAFDLEGYPEGLHE